MAVVSLVTGTRDREDAFHRLVGSIVRNTANSWELIVAQASRRPYRARDYPRNVVFIPEPSPLGPAAGYNRAFRRASSEWVIWLNDDCVVIPGYDSAALMFMRGHQQVGIGALSYTTVWGARDSMGVFGTSSWPRDLPYANFGVIRRDFGNSLGWFDEDLSFYGNDNSLAFKCYMNNKIVAPIPGKHVIHHVFDDPQRERNLAHQKHDSAILTRRYGHQLARFASLWKARRPS